ncbi:MAG: VCBS repeat-containing protein [Flavobacteriales bacterium]|nr:VCBS repeat-containing protein [Flavobacteriales bacterium]
MESAPEAGIADTTVSKGPLVKMHSGESIGMPFRNAVIETDDMNYYRYRYLYASGGVATGDVDGDSLPDVFLVSALDGCRLYHNNGGLRFTDITEKAGVVPGNIWATGTTMADINGDGHLDLYICCSGPVDRYRLRDRVYINDGKGTFTERGEELGITESGYNTMAYFYDLDQDNDLDLFLLGHRIDFKEFAQVNTIIANEKSQSTDRLYVNDGTGHFTERTAAMGLLTHNWGLSACIGDLTGDGRPDIFAANDFVQPDNLFVQEAGGKFRDQVKDRLGHISYFSMGSDLADFNNDGRNDLYVVDMTPPDHLRSKQNMASMRPKDFDLMASQGWHAQYMTNQLHMANGNGTFSEIAHIAGVDRTDWSWAALFVDLDNDGWKDLLVTNGLWQDISNNDFETTVKGLEKQHPGQRVTYEEIQPLMPQTPLPNYLFRNQGDLTFSKAMEEWGYDHKSASTGASYADLDRDGDMDLVVVDVNSPVKVVENLSRQRDGSHYLQIELEGEGANTAAIGATATLYTDAGMQYAELALGRGFQSSVEPMMHFGLGGSRIDSLVLRWPDGTWTRMTDVAPDQRLRIRSTAVAQARRGAHHAPVWFAESASTLGLGFTHKESVYEDLRVETLLPHRQSQHGPALAVADVNGDGRDDLFVSAAAGVSPVLWLQSAGERFTKSSAQPWSTHRDQEFIGACFFDADGDKDLDLYTAAGSTEFGPTSPRYQDRLYFNDGQGRFTEAKDRLPVMSTPKQVVTAHDVDGDGDQDLFVGGRNVPDAYPQAPKSYLLINDKGYFTDAIAQWCPTAEHTGMVTSAVFADLNADERADLLLAGEWMPLRAFVNSGQAFTPAPQMFDSTLVGWWFGLEAADLDGDGDQDVVAGNLGLNNKFHPSKEKPLEVYMADMDRSGTNDIVLAKHSKDDVCVPVRGRECSSGQMPFLAQKFPTFKSFAEADLKRLYGPVLDQALHYSATEFRSMVFRNEGGTFTPSPLPMLAQFSLVRGIEVADLNGDGHLDLVTVGNLFGTEVETTRYDASTGAVLLGDGKLGFTAIPSSTTGFMARGDARDVALLRTGGAPRFVVANNSGPLQVFTLTRPPGRNALAAR